MQCVCKDVRGNPKKDNDNGKSSTKKTENRNTNPQNSTRILIETNRPSLRETIL